MAVSKRTRYEVLRRDDHRCRYCHVTGSPLTVDHVIPVALGGTDDPANLVAACKDCNAGKSSTSPDAGTVAEVSDDAIRWAAAMKAAADEYKLERRKAARLYKRYEDVWETHNEAHRLSRLRLPSDWTESIDQWLKAGVPGVVIEDAMEIAMRNKRIENSEVWRYTCGIIWRKLTDLQEKAQQALAPRPERRVCGHCVACLEHARAEESYELYCLTYTPREPDEDPDVCGVCGGAQCAAGQARDAGLYEGYEAGQQHEWTRWYSSFERLQFGALLGAVDNVDRYGRAI